jgi:hypothetical protein
MHLTSLPGAHADALGPDGGTAKIAIPNRRAPPLLSHRRDRCGKAYPHSTGPRPRIGALGLSY